MPPPLQPTGVRVHCVVFQRASIRSGVWSESDSGGLACVGEFLVAVLRLGDYWGGLSVLTRWDHLAIQWGLPVTPGPMPVVVVASWTGLAANYCETGWFGLLRRHALARSGCVVARHP